MKMTRRVLALLLALCLTFGNVMPAMATGLEGEEPAVTEEITPVVPEVEETEAPAEAEETKAPVAEVTEAPVVETEAPVVETEAPVEETEALVEETIAQIVDEAANATATATISFANKAQRTSFSTSSQVWEQNGITVTNNKGGSSSNVGDYANPARFYKSSELIIAYPGMTKIEFTANSSSYASALKSSITTGTVTSSGSVVTWDLGGAVDSAKIASLSAQVRMNSLTVYASDNAGGDTCEHEWNEGVVTAATCFADGYTTYTCTLCGETKTGDVVAAGHKYEGDVCTVCGDGTVLTVAEAFTKGGSTGNNVYTLEKYRVTGKITEVYNTSYGNMYITDGNGNTLTVYGTYSANGATRYDKMDPQPVAGDTITVYGIIGNFNGTPQMKDGWIVAHTPAGSDPEPDAPQFDPENIGTDVNVTFFCAEDAAHTLSVGFAQEFAKGTDVYYDETEKAWCCNPTIDMAAYFESCANAEGSPVAGHTLEELPTADYFTKFAIIYIWDGTQWNIAEFCDSYEFGLVCGGNTEPDPSEPGGEVATSATLDFTTYDNRTSIGTTEQYWAQNGITLSNTGASSIRDNANDGHVRLYQGSKINIAYPGMTKLVFTCSYSTYVAPLVSDLSKLGTVTEDGLVVTLELAEAANEVEWIASKQERFTNLEVFSTGASVEEEEFIRPETPADIVAAAYALADGAFLKEGPYTLTGVITEINEVYNTEFSNITVTIVVEGCENQPIKCFRMKGTGADTLAVKDTITVTGELTNYSGTIEFSTGCSLDAVVKPEVINVAFDLSGTNWSSADAYLRDAAGSSFRIDLVKTESGVCYFGVDEYFPLSPAEIVSIGFCEHAGGGYTNIVAYENGKTYTAADFTITDESVTVYWDNSTAQLSDISVSLSCAHGGETGPNTTHFGEWAFVKSVDGDIYEYEIPACTAGHTIWFSGSTAEGYQNLNFNVVDGMTYPQCIGKPGHESNPEAVTFAWNETGTSATATVTVPAASTYYISFATGRGFMAPTLDLYANDVRVGSFSGTDFAPAVAALTNESEEAVEMALLLTYPMGDMMNPEIIYGLGDMSTTVAEGDQDGYYYSFTVESAGTLIFTVGEDVGETADIVVTNMNTYAQRSLLADGADGVLSLDVTEGDELQIVVASVPDADYNIAALNLSWNVNYPTGSEQNPVLVNFLDAETGDLIGAEVSIPAATTYFFQAYGIGGMQLSVNGEITMVLPEVMGRQPVVFELTNSYDSESTFWLEVSYPLGVMMNPEELVLGDQYTTLAEGNMAGYFYTYVADEAATLAFSFADSVAEGAADIIVTNMNTYAQRAVLADGVNGVLSLDVAAGDELQIVVVAVPDAQFNYPALELEWTANYALGSVKNPHAVAFAWNETGSSATATVTVPAASTYYISFATGRGFMAPTMELYADDVYVGSYSGTDFAPAVVGLTNESEEAVTVALRLSHPVGSQMNPDTLWSLGINYTSVEAGDSDGYYYTYTIEQDGTLNITTVDNGIVTDVVVEKVVNDIPVSKSLLMDGVDGVLTYDVAAGDVLTIQVVAVQDAAGNYYPAAEIEWNINYPAGSALNPIAVQPSMGFGEIESSTAVTIPAHTTYYVAVSTGVRGGEMLLTIDNEEYGIINATNWQPLVLELVNDSDEEITKILTLAFPAGSQMNPVAFGYTTDISDYISIEEGNTSGYHYTMTAPIDGTAEFYLDFACNPETGEDVAADINVFNLNTNEMKTMSEDGVDGCLLMDVSAEDELQINVVTQPDADWTYPAAEIAWRMFFTRGTEQNPERMNPGKNSVKIEANDEDGVYFVGGTESSGYVTITMNSSNWEYKVGYYAEVRDDEGNYMGHEMKWGDLQASNAKGAKSQTICIDRYYGDNFFLYVNTADKKAGTVTFTVTNVSKNVNLISGKSATLSFTDPATGKAIAASKVNWEIVEGADFATLTTAGKLTAAAGIEEPTTIYVLGTLKADETVTNLFYVTIRPVATSIQINKGHDYGEWVEEEENVTELTYVVNAYDNYPIELIAMVGPEAALQDVTWKSSNTKVLTIETESIWIDGVKMQYARLVPVHNSKNNTYGTGTVTLTATANDGSGVKATVKVNVVLETREINVHTKNYQWLLTPGKSLTMVADLRTGYVQGPTNKNVAWEIAEMYVMDYETYSWAPYVPAEGETPIITISNKGVVKAASNVDKIYEVVVKGTAQDTGVWATASFYVAPQAKTGEIVNVPATYDLNVGREIRPYAVFFDKNGNEAFTGYKWTTSNKGIAEVVLAEEQNENGEWFAYDVLIFKGKTGKVTLTATATDGSGKKATAVINVVKAPNEVRIDTSASVAAVGKTATLKATPGYYDSSTEEFSVASDKTVIWSFHEDDAELVAAVGAKLSNGKVTVNAKKFAAYIAENEQNWVDLRVVATAKLADAYGEEVSAEANVTFLPATTKVTMERFNEPVSGTVTIDDDDYVVLHAESAPETALDEYKWTTSNAKVATIEYNPDGSVTVRPVGKLGTAVIKATAMDGTNKSAQVTVKVVKQVDTLTIAEGVGVATTKSINLNKSLTINPTNASNKKVTWSWADEQSAADAKELKVTLNASGTLSAAKLKTISKPITLNVKVTAADGFGAVTTAPVTIYPATTKVELVDEHGAIAKTGNTVSHKLGQWQMTAVGTPEGVVLDEYKWTSSNAKVATVDKNGLVTFTGTVGSVTIKATAQDGTNKSAQTTIKVVKAVQEVSIPEDTFLGIAKGKTVTLSKSVVFNPADASSKNLTWTMELVQPVRDEKEGYVTGYETKDDGIVPKTMATLNANTGALKCVNVTEREYVKVTFTAKDGFGASGSAIVVLAPSAVKGLKVMAADFAEEFAYADLVDYTKKTYTTTSDAVMLYPEVTNYSDQTASGQTFTVNNKNFQVEWEMVTEVYVDEESGETKSFECANPVVRPVEGAANPYGTVKVTMKTTDGGNVSTYVTVKFVQPEPAT